VTDDAAPRPLTTPVFQILLSLAGGELHGYAIIQDIVERTGGEVRLTASTLYDAVKRLLDAGWIAESAARKGVRDDSRRRYYRITRPGLAAARAETTRIERLAAQARARLRRPQLRPTSPGSDR